MVDGFGNILVTDISSRGVCMGSLSILYELIWALLWMDLRIGRSRIGVRDDGLLMMR